MNNKTIEDSCSNAGLKFTNSVDTDTAKLKKLVEDMAESLAKESNIILGVRKEKARSWKKLKSGLYGGRRSPHLRVNLNPTIFHPQVNLKSLTRTDPH